MKSYPLPFFRPGCISSSFLRAHTTLYRFVSTGGELKLIARFFPFSFSVSSMVDISQLSPPCEVGFSTEGLIAPVWPPPLAASCKLLELLLELSWFSFVPSRSLLPPLGILLFCLQLFSPLFRTELESLMPALVLLTASKQPFSPLQIPIPATTTLLASEPSHCPSLAFSCVVAPFLSPFCSLYRSRSINSRF